MGMCEQWRFHYTSQWGQYMPLSEHVYCVAIAFKMNKRMEQRICITFCIKLEHSSVETIQMIQKATDMDNWWLAALSWQHAHSCVMSRVEFFGETSNHPGDSAPLQPRFGTQKLLVILYFWKGRDFRPSMRFRKINGVAAGDWENCVRYQVPTLEGTEASLSYVQCVLYLVSSSINVFIFHSTWLDTFWTDLRCVCVCVYLFMFISPLV